MIRFCSLKLLALSIVLWMTSATMRADDKNIKKEFIQKYEIVNKDLDSDGVISLADKLIDEVKFDLEDFAQKDTAYLHIYSPDNRYWGKWKINRKITSID